MRILIADDEYLARTSLRSMLEELDLPLDFVGEATNGEELVRLIGQSLPDVAFVDIRMPKLNGLEAIRKGKMVSPLTKWFILTGFPEFDYAKEAIQLGVSDYLLKPVNPDELSRVLNAFYEEYQKQITALNKQLERDLMAIQYGLASLEFDRSESILRGSRFIEAVVVFDSHLPESSKAARQFEFGRALRNWIARRADTHSRLALMVLPSGELATVGAWTPLLDGKAESELRQYFQDLEQEARHFSDQDFTITILVGPEAFNEANLQEQLDHLQQLAPLRIVCGIGQAIPIRALLEQAQRPGRLELCNQLLSLSRCYREKSYLNFSRALQSLDQTFAKLSLDENQALKKAVSIFIRRSIHCSLPVEQGHAAWMTLLQHFGERMVAEIPKEESSSADLIQQVLKFIDENYRDDIGIGQIAERLNITPNYLSTLVHKKTGTNFMSHLKKVRLLKAKELLNDPNIQIQQVAEQVGYSSARHFARLFAEQFGCLPSEYRDRTREEADSRPHA